MNAGREASLRSEVAGELELDQVRYSEVWEDEELLREGLQIEGDEEVLSITSAGSNVLALLLEEPKEVTAIDMNPAQTWFLELKIKAIQALEYADFLILMGLDGQGEERGRLYELIREVLSQEAREFWDRKGMELEEGIHRCGRLDRYFQGFREEFLKALWPVELLEELFEAPTLEEQAAIFDARAFTKEFQEAFRSYYGREKMASRGRSAAQFRYVEGVKVGDAFLKRFRKACREAPLRDNFYMRRFLTGEYGDRRFLPAYLKEENFERLKRLVERVRLVTEELEPLPFREAVGRYSKANLSDVFEYMSEEATEAMFAVLGERMKRGGRIAYWSLLVERRPGEGAFRSLEREKEFSGRDRAWFYRSFHLLEVLR